MEGQVMKIKFSQHAVILLFVLAGVALAIKDFMARGPVTGEAQFTEKADGAVHMPITPIPLAIPRTGHMVAVTCIELKSDQGELIDRGTGVYVVA